MKFWQNLAIMALASTSIAFAEPQTLEQVVSTALQNQYGIKIIRNQIKVAESGRVLATAGMLPKLDLTAGYVLSHKDATSSNATPINPNGVTTGGTLSGQLGLSWVLFDGFKMFRAYEQVHGTADLNQANAQVQIEAQVAQVMSAYWNFAAQQKLIERAQAQVDLSQSRLQYLASKRELGLSNSREYLQAQVDANADSSLLLDVKIQADVAMSQLNLLIGNSANSPLEVVSEIPVPKDPEPIEDLLQKAVSNNRELKLTQLKVLTTKYNLGISQANYWPSVSLNASYGYADASTVNPLDVTVNNESWTGQVGVNLKWNLFNGWQDRVSILNTSIENQNAQLDEFNKRLQVENTVRTAYAKLQQQLTRLRFEQTTLELAQKNFIVTEESQKAGLQSSLELRSAQQQLFAVQIKELQNRLAAQLAYLDLMRSVGGLSLE